MKEPAVRLPSPSIEFPEEFLQRLGHFAGRLSAARDRREGAGQAHLQGAGLEFKGYRPYRPGDDLRQLDWLLYARLRRPFVRVAQREASEHWTLFLDSSASMGVGRPGKLQRAAEVAACIGAAALSSGATLDLWTSAAVRFLPLRRPADLRGWLALLAEERAQGTQGLRALCSEPLRIRRAGRWFVLGDLLDLEPRHVFQIAGRREVTCVQILAPEELEPPRVDAVEWIDPEGGERWSCSLTEDVRKAYEHGLGQRLEAWRSHCSRHRASFGCWSTETSFEKIARALFD